MTMHPLSAPRRLDDLFLYRVTRFLAVAGAPVIRLCEGRYGITRREWRLIALLAQQGPRLSSDLADLAHLDRGRTSKAVTMLVDKGLATRSPRPNDRRMIEIALTPAGREIHDALFPEVARLNQELLSALDPDDLGRLDALLQRLQAGAEAWVAKADLPKADRQRLRRPQQP